jgi:hypothetical protein
MTTAFMMMTKSYARAAKERVSTNPMDVLSMYKNEFFDVFGELLTVAVDSGDGYLIADDTTRRVMKLRTMAFVDEADSYFEWHCMAVMLLLTQMRAETAGADELYHRAAFLVARAADISKKMRRQEVE